MNKRLLNYFGSISFALLLTQQCNAQGDCRSLPNTPTGAAGFASRGFAFYARGQYDCAIQDLDQAISLSPNIGVYFEYRGNVYRNKGQYDRAIQDFDQAIGLDPKLAHAFYGRGIAYRSKGQYDQSIQDFNQAINLNWSDDLAYNGLGNTYSDLGQYDRAIQNYDRAIQLNQNNAAAFNGRGNAYYYKGQYTRAIDDYDRAIKLNPNFATAINGRNLAEQKLKDNVSSETNVATSEDQPIPIRAPTVAQGAFYAWGKVSQGVRDCVGVAATRSNQTLEGMIASGVLPTDQRLSSAMQFCRQYVAGLKTNYSCKVKTPAGEMVDTICNQYYGVRAGSSYRKTSKEEAFALAFTARADQIILVDEETADGLQQREAGIRRALGGGSPPANVVGQKDFSSQLANSNAMPNGSTNSVYAATEENNPTSSKLGASDAEVFGRSFWQQSCLAQHADCIDKLVDLANKNPSVALNFVWNGCHNLGLNATCIGWLQRLVDMRIIDSAFRLALVYSERKEPAAEIEALKQEIAINPDSDPARNAKGRLAYIEKQAATTPIAPKYKIVIGCVGHSIRWCLDPTEDFQVTQSVPQREAICYSDNLTSRPDPICYFRGQFSRLPMSGQAQFEFTSPGEFFVRVRNWSDVTWMNIFVTEIPSGKQVFFKILNQGESATVRAPE